MGVSLQTRAGSCSLSLDSPIHQSDPTQHRVALRGQQLVPLLGRLEEEHVDQQHIVGPVVVFKGVALPLIVLGAL